MTREYCDRCGVECTGQQTGALHGIPDADSDGNGTSEDHFDILCLKCYRDWKSWMLLRPIADSRKRKAR